MKNSFIPQALQRLQSPHDVITDHDVMKLCSALNILTL